MATRSDDRAEFNSQIPLDGNRHEAQATGATVIAGALLGVSPLALIKRKKRDEKDKTQKDADDMQDVGNEGDDAASGVGGPKLLPAPKDSTLPDGSPDPNFRPAASVDHPIESFPAPEGTRVNQAIHSGQIDPATGQVHIDRIGGFSTPDDIPNVDFVRDELAVKPEWGPPKTHVQQLEIAPGTQIQRSVVGEQIGADGTIFPGGRTQIEIVDPNVKRSDVLTPIGPARQLPNTPAPEVLNPND